MEQENGPGTSCRGHSLERSGKEFLLGLAVLLAALTGLVRLILLSTLLAATLLAALVLLVCAFV
jgi:hypothetical protein